ncbi:hypothetical protein Tco_0829188 [Tanacetum coccineum]
MSPVANSSRVVDANKEVHDTGDQESSTRKRGPRGVNLNKNIPTDSSLRKVIHIDISGLNCTSAMYTNSPMKILQAHPWLTESKAPYINCMLVFVSKNQDQMSTKNESEVGLAQGRTGLNDTREHVQELERECANMKYEILEVKSKRGWSILCRLSNDVYRTILLDIKIKQNSGLIGNLIFKFVVLCC